VRWMYSRGHLEVDPDGVPLSRIGMVMDITEERTAREQLIQNSALLHTAGRIARLGGWTLELPEKKLTWSDENCAIHEVPSGYRPTFEEGVGYFPPEHREEVIRCVEACARDGTPYDFEVPKMTAKGRQIWVRSIGEAVRDAEGRIIRLQGAFQDITERKHLEQQYLRAQRVEGIGLLAGGIAHDLNNALAPILMSTDLLQQGEHDAVRLRMLGSISASAERCAAMVIHVLSFARGVDGKWVELKVPPLVQDVAEIVKDTFPKNITFEEDLSPELWSLNADSTQLHQVLINLCVNARDAMPAGGKITITSKNLLIDEPFIARNIDARLGPYVMIEVADTGTGIPAGIIDKIFDPFFTTKDIGKGTGLGLSTSLAIVKGHEGFMRAYSEPGLGARFCFYLPAHTAPATEESAVIKTIRPRGNGETVLVVDDEPLIRQIAEETLETFGYRVLLASDGADAVALYARHQPDIAVVLTDMMMPVMDGTVLIQELKKRNPDVHIICAGGLIAEAMEANVNETCIRSFLAKPYTTASLLTAIRDALA
jgi:two-component system cell cycle sensor histidine kinase/response regulator CckA